MDGKISKEILVGPTIFTATFFTIFIEVSFQLSKKKIIWFKNIYPSLFHLFFFGKILFHFFYLHLL